MQAMTPITPLERGGEMFSRAKTMSVFLDSWDRPVSVVTDTTEFEGQEEDMSDFDSGSRSRSASPDSGKRRSQTTIGSYDEAPTPRSGRGQRRLPLRLQSVEGPKGPHLFRSSQTSADFELALQMSPMLPKQMEFRTETAFSQDTITQVVLPDQSFDFSINRLSDSSTSSEVRRWTSTQVIDWLVDSQIESSIIACFELHDITGDVLMDLTFEDLKDLGVTSFGKRHQLWNLLCILQGRPDDLSPCQTTFDDVSRPCTTRPEAFTPIDDGTGKKRRGRKPAKTGDVITPGESVSIVAIEQLLPKAHRCAKGERCAKWRKQQRELQRLQDEHELGQWPISPTKGGHIFVAGNPGNASTADHMQTFAQQADDFYRPQSEAEPSVVASSDLLGPGQLPDFVLDADMLDQLDKRDPQENVKAFLSFQHLNSPCAPMDDVFADAILTPVQSKFKAQEPVFEMFPSEHVPSFAATQPAFQLPQRPHTANQQLKSLPRLDIPRSSSAQATAARQSPLTATQASPVNLVRFATPASDMDVPVSAQPIIPRNTSQSVPPDMQYRQQKPLSRSHSRTGKWRRPSMALESVKENEILSPVAAPRPSISTQRSGSSGCISTTSSLRSSVPDPAHHEPEVKVFGYGTDCTQAGWMRKRKTKLLRHEWQDAHFRLKGSELAMHADEKYHSAAKETINVDQYSVACSSGPSASKLGAAFKSLAIMNSSPEKKGKVVDPTAFAFQLVPESKDRERFSSAKTHHFAVKTKDERIDWMRELMLAKALQAKREGYEVEINGVQA
ncbi:hypothetical protein AMS68_006806 [Peltaster fructicola]|uniref:SAM and PH domain-containing protein n=1 Tax=Peltaster fructicola TaxID=286661 RepID=A0A6H0Y355_9PEZI|nr:hypothetical protein AMS68_006806 [Peltaster fructicola]